MIFRVDHTNADTCGNEWVAGETEYIEAATSRDAWIKLGSPSVSRYWLDGGNREGISRIRTPNGEGYGQWEDNPEFDFERDIDGVTSFKSGAFVGLNVYKIDVR